MAKNILFFLRNFSIKFSPRGRKKYPTMTKITLVKILEIDEIPFDHSFGNTDTILLYVYL